MIGLTRSQTLLVGLAVALTAGPLAGQALPRERPEAVGMSAERLARVQEVLQSHVERGEVAGAVALVMRDGRLVSLETAGVLDAGTAAPMRADAIFQIASMTKPVTSTAIMMLVEEGKVALSDPLSKFIPAFGEARVLAGGEGEDPGLVPMRREINIRDLLTHRSGLTYGFLDRGPVGNAYRAAGVSDGIGGGAITMAENVERLAAQPLAHQPGSAYRYGLSTDVLGRVVEVASGMPLDEFFRTRIFEPLGMVDTDFSVPMEKGERLATIHAMQAGATPRPLLDAEAARRQAATRPALLSGGAGLYSTAEDYARFLQMLLNGGELNGARLLGPKTVELMTMSHTEDLGPGAVGAGRAFGLGFAVTTQAGASTAFGSVGSYDWGGIYGTTFWVDPAENLLAVGMIQLSPNTASQFREMLRASVYQALTSSLSYEAAVPRLAPALQAVR
jgi:CubicO group peptidase (beta-lactamase class C family)